MSRQRVAVDVATMWTSPDAPREIDSPAVLDEPDIQTWVKSLDAETRMGLHGRTLTQLLRDEPVEVLQTRPDGWVEVAATWQPAPETTDGYHGWVRQAHLRAGDDDEPVVSPQGSVAKDQVAIMADARRHLGLQYLWGGMSRWGLDCSGLVHHAYRAAGVVVPRDAYAQQAAATPVELGDEQPGDLYFFAREDGRVFHVGFVTGPLRMLHAPETRGGGLIEDVDLPPDRRARLAHVGRFLT